MNDRIFFPLIVALSVGLVAMALFEERDALPTGSISGADTDYRVIRVADADLNRFLPGEDARATLVRRENGLSLVLRATGDSFPSSADAGPHFRLAPDLETVFSGRRIRVNLRARPAPVNGATAFEISYLAGPEGRSRWMRFDLGEELANYAFDFVVPEATLDQGVDFIGVRPVIAENQTGIEIESLTLVNLELWRSAVLPKGYSRSR